MQARVDDEVSSLIDEGYKKAEKIIKVNRKVMDDLVKKLLEVETIEQEEFERIMGESKVVIK